MANKILAAYYYTKSENLLYNIIARSKQVKYRERKPKYRVLIIAQDKCLAYYLLQLKQHLSHNASAMFTGRSSDICTSGTSGGLMESFDIKIKIMVQV
ncbi:hypothetical protein ACJX0J_037787, partial [Zea mays]